jgi:signal transduction histidine kinase
MIQGVQTMICVPIMSQDNVDGIVYIDSGQLFNPMTQDDMTFAAAVANEMALSIENLRLQRESLRNERMAAIGMTITNIAHNIRNLVNVNFNAVDLMGIHLDKIDDEKIHKNWGLVRRGFERMTNLSADMLDFAKDITMELKPVNINRVVLDNQDVFEQSLVSRSIEIELQLTPDNPTWMMDETQFQRALHNLIVNAIDAVKENETGRIRISTAVDENQCLRVSVTDNGGGIDPQHREKIFDLFYTTKGTGGSGLGLPMVKKFIDKMDGELLLESSLDTGTTFAMVFPSK